MSSIAQSLFRDSEIGVEQEIEKAGSALEHRMVYDETAKELRQMASQGLLEIVDQSTLTNGEDVMIDHLRFKRIK